MTMIRGIRGATTVQHDEEKEIIVAVESLLAEMIQKNEIHPDKVASVFVSVTKELQSTFPSKALRNLDGWKYVPVVCMQEIPVEGSLPFCIRIMLHLNTDKTQQEIEHVYQGEAVALRPDLKN